MHRGVMMSKIKKIWNWFLSVERNEGFFYGEDEKGLRVFYPWGKPGEAYYISKIEEKIYNIWDGVVSVFFLILFLGAMYLDATKVIESWLFNLITTLVLLGLVVYYFFYVFLINKKFKPYLLPLAERTSKTIKGCIPWYGVLSVMIMGFYLYDFDILYTVIPIVFVTFYFFGLSFFIYKLKKTKGYIFNK
jgi:hypothetical protein